MIYPIERMSPLLNRSYRMSKKDLLEETTQLNEELLDEFSDELESTINKVCEDNPDVDPRLELLVTLGLFSSQVAIDSGYNKEDFLLLIGELFDDTSAEQEESDEVEEVVDKSKFN